MSEDITHHHGKLARQMPGRLDLQEACNALGMLMTENLYPWCVVQQSQPPQQQPMQMRVPSIGYDGVALGVPVYMQQHPAAGNAAARKYRLGPPFLGINPLDALNAPYQSQMFQGSEEKMCRIMSFIQMSAAQGRQPR